MTSLLPGQQSADQARIESRFEQGLGGLFFRDPANVSGFQFLNGEPITEDEVALTFFIQGRVLVMKTVAKRIGTEWKFYGGLTF